MVGHIPFPCLLELLVVIQGSADVQKSKKVLFVKCNHAV